MYAWIYIFVKLKRMLSYNQSSVNFEHSPFQELPANQEIISGQFLICFLKGKKKFYDEIICSEVFA